MYCAHIQKYVRFVTYVQWRQCIMPSILLFSFSLSLYPSCSLSLHLSLLLSLASSLASSLTHTLSIPCYGGICDSVLLFFFFISFSMECVFCVSVCIYGYGRSSLCTCIVHSLCLHVCVCVYESEWAKPERIPHRFLLYSLHIKGNDDGSDSDDSSSSSSSSMRLCRLLFFRSMFGVFF